MDEKDKKIIEELESANGVLEDRVKELEKELEDANQNFEQVHDALDKIYEISRDVL